MKLKLSIIIIFVMSFFIASCGDDDSTNPSDNVKTTFNANIEGADWNAESAEYFTILRQLSGTIVDSTDTENIYTESIRIRIPDTGLTIENKTYTTNCSYLEIKGTGASADVTGWVNANGICEITLVNEDRLAGTFSFEGTNADDQSTKTITGSFNVEIDKSNATLWRRK